MLQCSVCRHCIDVGWVPSQDEVMEALETLYVDRLKPFGRMLLKRLRELAAKELAETLRLDPDKVDETVIPHIHPKKLRVVVESCPLLTITPEAGREYSVTVQGRSSDFVDICCIEDIYPKELR